MMPEQPDWMENDELARRETEKGWKWQRYVADFFEASGFPVDLPPYTWRKSVEDIKDHADSRDMTVAGQRIEVKSRNLLFNSIPMTFPYERAFVDTVRSYDHYKEKPIAYVFVSQLTGAMLATIGRQDAANTWEVAERYDEVRQITDKFYTVDRRKLTTVIPLVRRLREIHEGL
jgi:hypothetical protein